MSLAGRFTPTRASSRRIRPLRPSEGFGFVRRTPPTVRHTNNLSGAGSDYMTSWYSYFGRFDLWSTNETSRPDLVTRNTLEAKRILMADSVWLWMNRYWGYNHGRNGPAYHCAFMWAGVGGIDGNISAPACVGLNQAYGDGHVRWFKMRPLSQMAWGGTAGTSLCTSRRLTSWWGGRQQTPDLASRPHAKKFSLIPSWASPRPAGCGAQLQKPAPVRLWLAAEITTANAHRVYLVLMADCSLRGSTWAAPLAVLTPERNA